MLAAWPLAVACQQALAQTALDVPRDGVTERLWLDVPESRLSPQAALKDSWTPLEGPLSRGFTASTTCVRVKVDPAAAGPTPIAGDHRVVLRIVPGHLDEVTVWQADRLSQPPVLLGDKHSVVQPQQGLLNYAAVFDDATAPFEVLSRLRT